MKFFYPYKFYQAMWIKVVFHSKTICLAFNIMWKKYSIRLTTE